MVDAPAPLTEAAIRSALAELPGWALVAEAGEQALVRRLRFADFAGAFRYMQEAAAVFEAAQHHPRWTNNYATLEIALTTHDAGGRVTSRDVAVAKLLDNLSQLQK